MTTSAPHRLTAGKASDIHGGAYLDDLRDARLTCLRGSAWITVDGEQRDIVLEPGESFVVDSSRPVLVQALRAGGRLDLRITPPALPRHPPAHGWMQSLRARFGTAAAAARAA